MREEAGTLHINESADKLVLKTKVKRGTDTRDQDTIEVKVKGNDPGETVQKLNDTLRKLSDTTVTAAREMQAVEEVDDE